MKIPRPALLAFAAFFAALAPVSSAQALGPFEDSADVGSPKLAGSTAYNPVTQEFLLSAGGTNMWAARDEFQFVWKKLKGDFIVRTRIEFLAPGVNNHRKAGLIARAGLDADAPYADACEHGDRKLTSLQFRRTKGAITEQVVLPITGADILQLERRGDTYIFSAARPGEPFVSAEVKDLALGDELHVGLFLCSHDAAVKEHAVFHDVSIIKPVKPGFTPYRDYIGSILHLLEVHTGRLETIHQSAEPFEAPNWTTDGAFLIYNISGRGANRGLLHKFSLATRTSAVLKTGTANRNNNDHVLSFDGKQLGISHQGPETNNRSAVYVLPAAGGQPRLVTPKFPSYLHGWSPDAKWLVYTGGRKPADNPTGPDKYDIYKILADGTGEEIRLTDSPGLSDGPEFSPDGQWIYFNSTRTGLMQLWRMKPDGSAQEQITNDGFNDWFPHLSPDGKWIVFISYRKEDVKPDDHPYYKHCYLRLMPVTGGKPKVIAYLYGGQGTINVPSWSPDSRRIAFVTNSDL
ncbi:MAG: biopolymer transporter TolR [Opitutaceae bacterium]|nr:biopolymer transporter TolR [Opitutaceae bacterium]